MDRRDALLALASAVGLAPFALTEAAAQMAAPVGPDEYRAMALMGGEFSIETSRLALERSRDPAVRQFANVEIDEQVKIAASLGSSPGAVPPRPDQIALVQRLAATPPGRGFDQAYVRGQILGHQELLQLNSTYAQAGFDFQGSQVASASLPIIQQHLSVLGQLRRA